MKVDGRRKVWNRTRDVSEKQGVERRLEGRGLSFRNPASW